MNLGGTAVYGSRSTLLGTIALLLLAAGLDAREPHGKPPPAAIATVFDRDSYLCANRLLIFSTNYGVYARDVGNVFGYDYGCFFPFSNIGDIESGANTLSPLYSAGIWIAGKVNGEIRATVSAYDGEFTPGPVLNGSFPDGAATDPAYRVYCLYADSSADNPNQDYLEWPDSMGAPLDANGRPVRKGAAALWAVYNDLDSSRHILNSGSTAPLGIEVQQYMWVTGQSPDEQSVYIRYFLYNRGQETIDSCFVGLFADPDIGRAGDDVVGSNPGAQFIYAFNGNVNDLFYGSTPPALGLQMLKGPLVPAPGMTGYFREATIPDMMNLGVHALSCMSRNSGRPFPESPGETYNVLRGLTVDGQPRINPVTGDTTRFDFAGSPFLPDPWLDMTPDDKYMVVSAGPFTFAPGDSQIVYGRIAVGQSDNNLSAIQDLGTRLRGASSLTIDPEKPSNPENPDNPGGGEVLPNQLALSPNYPNPFNAETRFSYSLPKPDHVTVDIVNAAGQVVKTLIDRDQAAGTYDLSWHGDNMRGEPVATGIYFYRLRTHLEAVSRKMTLVK